MSARYIVGDVFDVLATLEPDSVDLVFSSPPFLALRSYLPADHPDKVKEIGSEATPADFLDTLLDVVEACDRVLAPRGSLCFELGDTYADSGQSPNQKFGEGNASIIGETGIGRHRPCGPDYPLAKSLCLIPTLFAASLAYGYNMLRPERTTPRWRVRNLVVWARPNPPVGALGDKFRPATSYLTVACKSGRRYFDLGAVRNINNPDRMDEVDNPEKKSRVEIGPGALSSSLGNDAQNPYGAPPLDYWVIPTHPYPGSHYATFPPDLVVKPVASMCPQRVCRVCGEPSRRITERTEEYAAARAAIGDFNQRDEGQGNSGSRSVLTAAAGRDITSAENVTIGWTDCGHDDWRAGTVLDPFAGSGTTLAVATGHGRDAIGIDLDGRNADLALERVGPMFLAVEHLTSEGAA